MLSANVRETAGRISRQNSFASTQSCAWTAPWPPVARVLRRPITLRCAALKIDIHPRSRAAPCRRSHRQPDFEAYFARTTRHAPSMPNPRASHASGHAPSRRPWTSPTSRSLVGWARAAKIPLVPRGSGSSMPNGADRRRCHRGSQPLAEMGGVDADARERFVSGRACCAAKWMQSRDDTGFAFRSIRRVARSAPSAAWRRRTRLERTPCGLAPCVAGCARSTACLPMDHHSKFGEGRRRRSESTRSIGFARSNRDSRDASGALDRGARGRDQGFVGIWRRGVPRVGRSRRSVGGKRRNAGAVHTSRAGSAFRPRAATSSVLGAFESLEAAVAAAVAARAAGAAACELLDRTFLDVAASGGAPRHVPADTECALLAEVEGAERRRRARERSRSSESFARRARRRFASRSTIPPRPSCGSCVTPRVRSSRGSTRVFARCSSWRTAPCRRSISPAYVRGVRAILACPRDARGDLRPCGRRACARESARRREPAGWRARIDAMLDRRRDAGRVARRHAQRRARRWPASRAAAAADVASARGRRLSRGEVGVRSRRNSESRREAATARSAADRRREVRSRAARAPAPCEASARSSRA